MRNVSVYYQKLVTNTYRPRCEPTITVKSKDGETDSYTFKSSNIVELKINQKIDVLGKELPTIELEWSTFYNNQNDFAQMMYHPVALSFSQSLGPHTWRNLYDNYTWKDISDEEFTWKSLANKELTTDIDFCTLFISEEPTIKDGKIIFKARNALYFMNAEVSDKVYGSNLKGTSFFTPIQEFLESAKKYIPTDATALKQTIEESATSIYNYFKGEELDRKIQVSSNFKDFLKNYLSLKNAYIYLNSSGGFQADKFSSKGYDKPDYTLNGNLMFNKPTVQEISKVSIYENTYNYYDNVNGEWLKGPNRVLRSINVDNVEIGETFTEKNPLWAYRESDYKENSPNVLRNKHIDTYYYEGGKTVEVECLPNLSIEMGDVIKVEYKDISNRDISHDAIVVKSELTYNGAFREKIYLHTMKGDDK